MFDEKDPLPSQVWLLVTKEGDGILHRSFSEPPGLPEVFIFGSQDAAEKYKDTANGISQDVRDQLVPEGPFPFGEELSDRQKLAERLKGMDVVLYELKPCNNTLGHQSASTYMSHVGKYRTSE